jgi:hypothetical protein
MGQQRMRKTDTYTRIPTAIQERERAWLVARRSGKCACLFQDRDRERDHTKLNGVAV